MPMGQYKDFDDCFKRAPDKVGDKKKYCGKIFWKTHGKEKGKEALKKKLEEMRFLLNKYKVI